MKQLFNLLPLDYPLILLEKELKSLLSGQEFTLLEKIGVLALDTPLNNISCQTCGEFHEVHVPSQSKAFYVCPEAGKEMVDVHDLRRWRFQYEQLFDSLSHNLGITRDFHVLKKKTCWQLGTIPLNNENIQVFFYRGKIDDAVVKDFPGIILMATFTQNSTSPDCLSGLISLTNLLEDKPVETMWSKSRWDRFVTKQRKFVSTGIYSYPIELIFSGKELKICGSQIDYQVFLASVHSDGSGVLLDPIFKICKAKPTGWVRITAEAVTAVKPWGSNPAINDVLKNLPQFAKYTSYIGLKKPIRNLFFGGINKDGNSFKFRTALPVDEWEKMPQEVRTNIVKYLKQLPSLGN